MKKKVIRILLTALMVFSLSACSQTAGTGNPDAGNGNAGSSDNGNADNGNVQADSGSQTDGAGTDGAQTGNVLIAYFSWSGNTAEMASYIQEQTGGDLYEIVPVTPYPEDYNECGAVALEERDANARPEIQDLPESLDGYDTLFIGYPIWWHTAPMIIGTFLENYDLTGVDVYPFTQSASMDTEQFDNSMDFVRETAGNGTVHDGLFVRASDTEAISEYLTQNGFGV